MNRKYLVAAALLAFTVAGHAQDMSENFSGPYVGGQVGYGNRSIDVDFGLAGVPDFDRDRDSIDYGAFFGFDAPIGMSFVLGGEAEVGSGGRVLRQTLATGLTATVDPDWNYLLSGRAGFLAGDRALIFGRLGYGAEKVDIRVTDTTTPANSFRDNGWSKGAVYGGGVEYALSPISSARVEYRYKDFEGSYTNQQILAGFSFRF